MLRICRGCGKSKPATLEFFFREKTGLRSYLRWCLRNGKGGRKTETLLGYTMAELREHLERQFLPGMNWENYGEWHIDHIVPLSSFKIATVEDAEFRACWAITNLRPIWAVDNIRKADRRLLLI